MTIWGVIALLADNGHWFLALCLILMICYALRIALMIGTRTLRVIQVIFHGWPPAHLDADGDWRPAEKPDDETKEQDK